MVAPLLRRCAGAFAARLPDCSCLEKSGPKNKKPTQLASGSNLSALLLWLQIRPSPSFMWVPKAKPIGVGVVMHEGSVLRARISRKLFLVGGKRERVHRANTGRRKYR